MGQTLQEFSMKWSHWQQECRHRLESETYAANPHLHILCQVKNCKFKLLMLILVLPILIMYEIFLYILLLKIILVREIAFINYLSGECTLHWPWKSSLVLSRYFVVRKKYLMKWCKLPWPTFQSIAAQTIHQLLAANVTFSRSFTNLSFLVNGMNDRLY